MVSKIISQYKELIEIQTIKAPHAVRGLQVSLEQVLKIELKLKTNKKLNKFENHLVTNYLSVENHLEKYIKMIS